MAILEAGAGLAWPGPPNSGGVWRPAWADAEGRRFFSEIYIFLDLAGPAWADFEGPRFFSDI